MPRPWIRTPFRHASRLVLPVAVGAALVMGVPQDSTSGTSSSISVSQEMPPPNVLFLLDLSTAMNTNCCMGLPCLEDVKKAILGVRRHNDWMNMGVIGTTSSSSWYFPIAPLGSSTAEIQSALSKVTVNPTNTRDFGTSLWAVTWLYLRYGIWDWSKGTTPGSPITQAAQQTHVVLLTKDLPSDDPDYYSTVVSWLYTTDAAINLAGTQNIITHAIEIGGVDSSDSAYSNGSKKTDSVGLFLTPTTYEELVASISLILRDIRTDFEVRSVALVNTGDGKAYATQYTLEQDGALAIGDLLQYDLVQDPDDPHYGEIDYDSDSLDSGATWSAGRILKGVKPALNELNGPGKRRIYTFFPDLMTCLPSSSTYAKKATTTRRMDLDASLSSAIAGTTCVDKFIKQVTYPPCTVGSDYGNVSSTDTFQTGLPTNTTTKSASGVCDATFSQDMLSATINCTKSITKVTSKFSNNTTKSYSVSSLKTYTANETSLPQYSLPLQGVTVYAGSTTGEYIANICYPSGCAIENPLTLSGIVRDFTPAKNTDFEYTIVTEKGIVKSKIGNDRKPTFTTGKTFKTVHSKSTFEQWYNNVSDVNVAIPYSITLGRTAGSSVYTYSNSAFFPIDGQGWGNEGRVHNYHFTYELHGAFTYSGGEYFSYTGDDDLWVFINDNLVIDLGGIHTPISATVNLDTVAKSIGISKGGTYNIDFFFAERHTILSNLKISTTMLIVPTDPSTSNNGATKYMVCHVPPGNPGNAHTIVIAQPAVVNAHLKNHAGDAIGPCSPTDLSGDGAIDHKDVQVMVDFVRGAESSVVKYLAEGRGESKLADSKRSVPTIVMAEEADVSMEASYVQYLNALQENQAAGAPDLVLMSANDGMLHAFDKETGEEVWAWVPAQVLSYDQPASWSGRVVESAMVGQTDLFDGTPVVEDVWIDGNADGEKSSDEWHRIVLTPQGTGGPAMLALDITNPTEPTYLWEQIPDTTTSATNLTTSQPLITSVLDTTGPTAKSVPVVLWASGDGAPAYSPSGNYTSSEASIYVRAVSDNPWAISPTKYSPKGTSVNPDPINNKDLDLDGLAERTYIAGSMSGVDVNGDNNVDTLYFPVSVTYEPLDMGDVDGDGKTGLNDPSDPGYAWMYKAVMNSEDPDTPATVKFYDPKPATGNRPEVTFPATTAWMPDGDLGVFWGTGGPDNRFSDKPGYFFAMEDPAPTDVTTIAMPVAEFGTNGVYSLGNGEILTWQPVIYAGTVYFVTYVPTCATCTTGVSRIYGLTYDTGDAALDLSGDGVPDSAFYQVSGPIGSFKVSDEGILFYGTSKSLASGQGSISVGTLRLGSARQEGVRPISWAEIW